MPEGDGGPKAAKPLLLQCVRQRGGALVRALPVAAARGTPPPTPASGAAMRRSAARRAVPRRAGEPRALGSGRGRGARGRSPSVEVRARGG